MDTQFTTQPKPTLLNIIAWTTLASGIVNLFWGVGFSLTVVLGTFGVGVLCLGLTILPTVLGIFEIIYAAKLMSNPPQPVQPSTTIAILEVICVLALNLFSVVVGVLSLVFYNDGTVREYFARINGKLVPVTPPAPVPPVEPAPAPEPEPVPVTPEPPPARPAEAAPPVEPAPSEEPPAPAPEKAPPKPKRPRKVARK